MYEINGVECRHRKDDHMKSRIVTEFEVFRTFCIGSLVGQKN